MPPFTHCPPHLSHPSDPQGWDWVFLMRISQPGCCDPHYGPCWQGFHLVISKTQPNSRTHPAIQHTLTLTKKTLNRYYSLTDESEVYWIVMGKPSLIFSMYYTDLTPLSQFFILNTSLNILSKPAGQPNGLKLQKHSWVKSSRKPTRTEHKMAMARMRITKTVQVLESPSWRTVPR